MGKLAEIKTKETGVSPEEFISTIEDEQKRKDSLTVLKLMKKVSGEKPKMWGTSIVGFGKLRYKSPSGREVDWFKIGFSPRKANLTLYLASNVQVHAQLLKKFGPHKTGGGCLYIKRLEDVDVKVLETMLRETLKSK
ncbi:MAG: DUF1801 domain-containing protein [Bacteroidetes bacterium]|nr:DUF1801 domain-containing protein [Bacteroidota bacterium]